MRLSTPFGPTVIVSTGPTRAELTSWRESCGVCLDGQNACPPEDVGGPHGYEQFLEALSEPLHEEHDSYLVWVGYKFEADAFDLAAANAALQRVR